MDNVLFYHGKTVDGRRFTVSGMFTTKGRIFKRNILSLGASLCSKTDCFVKKVGRYKAEGRMNSKHSKGKVITLVPESFTLNPVGVFLDNVLKYTTLDSTTFQKHFNLYTPNSHEKNHNLSTAIQ